MANYLRAVAYDKPQKELEDLFHRVGHGIGIVLTRKGNAKCSSAEYGGSDNPIFRFEADLSLNASYAFTEGRIDVQLAMRKDRGPLSGFGQNENTLEVLVRNVPIGNPTAEQGEKFIDDIANYLGAEGFLWQKLKKPRMLFDHFGAGIKDSGRVIIQNGKQ